MSIFNLKVNIEKERAPQKIMFAGASGTGKTTLCHFLTEKGIPFISGSVSDLLPQTKAMPHKDMLARDSQELFREDYQILNLRNKAFSNPETPEFVTDRSYIDCAAYFIYKQADKVPQCEIEQYFKLCQMCLSQQCTHLIFIPFTEVMFNSWVTEDNGKRITSKFFQMEISRIMKMAIDLMGYKTENTYKDISRNMFKPEPLRYGWEEGEIRTIYGTTKVLILNEPGLEIRKEIIKLWLGRK